MEDKNIVIVDETTIYEVDGACVEEMRKRKTQVRLQHRKGHRTKKLVRCPFNKYLVYLRMCLQHKD